ncbi:MAG TPA: hypothetical protein VGL82_16605 [Bryobacteraceae bacterium]
MEYSRAAMEQIRRRARNGLMAAPRVGMGVGGLLLGVRNGARVRVLDSIDIPCSHSAGPAFELTPDEKRETREMIAEAGSPDISRKVGVIGWYCSKTRDDLSLSAADRSLFDELLPGPWQVALVVRPNVVDAMRAAFFFRDDKGAVAKGLECYVDEWRPAPEAEPEAASPEAEAEGKPETERKPEAVEPLPDRTKIVRVTEEEPSIRPTVALQAEIPVPERRVKAAKAPAKPIARNIPLAEPIAAQLNPTIPVPSFGISESAPTRLSGNGRLALKIAIPVLLVLLASVLTWRFWMPRPPLAIDVTELDGTLLIRWNPDALRGVDHASMFVNDGGQRTPVLIPLDHFQLTSGLLSYRPQSKRVTAKLDAGETSAIGSWFAPQVAAPATPPEPAVTGEASPPTAQPSSSSPPSAPPTDGKTAK